MKKKLKLPNRKLKKMAVGDVVEEPMITEKQDPTVQPPISIMDGPIVEQPPFNPALTKSLQDYYRSKGQRAKPYLSPEERDQYTQYRRSQIPDPTYTGLYNVDMAQYDFNRSNQLAGLRDATEDDDLARQYEINSKGYGVAGVGHTAAAIFNTARNTLGAISTIGANQRAKMNELQRFNLENRERALIDPIYGDRSELGGGTNPAFAKNGKAISGRTFLPGQMQRPNVITERGETISDPTRGPLDPNGDPLGLVVYDGTGDEHSDPSGGNEYLLGNGAVVHSKSLGVPVGDLVQASKNFKNGGKIGSKLMSKYKNPNKEISYSDAAKLFDTRELVDELGKVNKRLEKEEEYSSSPLETSISQKTAKLNAITLKKQAEAIENDIAFNTEVTGVNGPIHQLSENLKSSGAYGKSIQKEQATAKYGKAMLPIAKRGKKIDGNDKDKGYYPPDQLAAMGYYDPNNPLVSSIPVANQQSSLTTNRGIPIGPTSIPGTDYDPTDVNHIFGLLYDGKDAPRKDQKAKGINAGFNSSQYMNNPEQLMQDLAMSGFTPPNGDWKKVGTSDIQKHLLNVEKGNGYKNMKMLYETLNQTNQGFGRNGGQNKPWSTLTEKEKEDWFADNYNGVRTGFVAMLNKNAMNTIQANLNNNPAIPVQNKTPQILATSKVSTSPYNPRRIYREGLNPLQILPEIGQLLEPKQAVPYIEDQGAKDALAMNTMRRYTDIQPQLNRITRGVQAQNRFRDGSPINQANAAQSYANAYEAANEVYGQKYNADAAIDDQYNQRQMQLRTMAGANKAKALDTLADRTATRDWKATALYNNALGSMSNKFLQNNLENRTSVLLQDMFPNYGYNPYSGTEFQGNGYLPQINIPLNTTGYVNPNDAYDVTENYDASGNLKGYTRKKKSDPTVVSEPSKKYGGKVKSLPKRKLKK